MIILIIHRNLEELPPQHFTGLVQKMGIFRIKNRAYSNHDIFVRRPESIFTLCSFRLAKISYTLLALRKAGISFIWTFLIPTHS